MAICRGPPVAPFSSLGLIFRDDLLQIRPSNQNHTFSAQAVNRGVTLVGVWDERHPGMADYIAVPVEHAIEPGLSAPLAVGDVVCFSTPLVSQEGQWASRASLPRRVGVASPRRERR